MKTTPFLCASVCSLVLGLASAPVVPGEHTDPTNLKAALKVEEAWETPVDFQHPYVATYYVKPLVTTKEKIEIGFYVTDFDHSLVRNLDGSHRFDAFLEYYGTDGKIRKLSLKNIKSGDSKFTFGPLKKGDYNISLWAVDLKKGIESHRVKQEFRVMEPDEFDIPASKVYRMTEGDLEKYGVSNKGDLGRKVLVEVAHPPKGLKFLEYFKWIKDEVKKYADANPRPPREGEKGYTVYIPARDGRTIVNSWRSAYIVNDPGYDTNKVEEASIKTAEGLQKLLDDKAAAGYRKVVLYPGTYRMSHTRQLNIPSHMTLDLNGATLKQNAFAGAGSLLVGFDHVDNAHLVNGTLEGDYYEHYYDRSPNNSEWPHGFAITGESRYCSVRNVRITEITGYGASNGAGERNGQMSPYYRHIGGDWTEGALDRVDGTLDKTRKDLFTSGFIALETNKSDRLQVSKYLGYQGVRTRQWTLTACWYDKDKKFLSSETVWQYRVVPVPAGAAFLRLTQFNSSLKAARECDLSLSRFYIPQNCSVVDCTFDRCRCVGYAASAMKNFLFKGNFFTHSGESAAKCAFDAEDGWDMMQDTFFIGNKCRDNPVNNSLLTCAGHNFVFENNDCSFHFWPRTHSPCVRDNKIGSATFMCDGRVRTGYGRFERNTYSGYLNVPGSNRSDRGGWDYAFHDLADYISATNRKSGANLSDSARIVNAKFTGHRGSFAKIVASTLENCNITRVENCYWYAVAVKGGDIGNFHGKSTIENCVLTNVKLVNFYTGTPVFRNCTFTDCAFLGIHGKTITFENCTFKGSSRFENYPWARPADISFRNCTIEFSNAYFMKMSSCGIGRILFDSCVSTATAKDAILCDINDWRSSGGDAVDGFVTIEGGRYDGTFKHLVGCSSLRWRGFLPAGKGPAKKVTCSVKGAKTPAGSNPVGAFPK